MYHGRTRKYWSVSNEMYLVDVNRESVQRDGSLGGGVHPTQPVFRGLGINSHLILLSSFLKFHYKVETQDLARDSDQRTRFPVVLINYPTQTT